MRFYECLKLFGEDVSYDRWGTAVLDVLKGDYKGISKQVCMYVCVLAWGGVWGVVQGGKGGRGGWLGKRARAIRRGRGLLGR